VWIATHAFGGMGSDGREIAPIPAKLGRRFHGSMLHRCALSATGVRLSTMRYIGSKGAIVETVLDHLQQRESSGTLCDPFGGLGTIGAAARRRGYKVYSGDILHCAVAFQTIRLGFARPPTFKRLMAVGLVGAPSVERHLQSLSGREGWLVRNYARERRFYSVANARRIEACRQEIETWRARSLISEYELRALRASLIASSDRVANTAGTYYAHLKVLSAKARRAYRFELLSPAVGPIGHTRLCDASVRSAERPYTILYLDPPYNRRSYAHYYHLPETLARGETPLVRGRAGVPDRAMARSHFNSRPNAQAALEAIVATAEYHTLAFHYADDGIIDIECVRAILRARGPLAEVTLSAPGYTVTSRRRRVEHHLFLVDG